jgi:DNA-binding MarR family transcriptional regulator
MFKIFGDNFQDLFLKFYFQAYLLIERSLRIRSQNKLTIREMLLVGLLDRMKKNNDHTVMNIAKYLQVSPPVISNSVKSLIRKGYLKKVLNTNDNRVYFLELTEQGKLSNQRSFQFGDKLVKKSVGNLSLFDIRSIIKAFKIVEKVIDEENRILDNEEISISESKSKI